MSFWNVLDTFPGYIWTIFKLFWTSCMSVSVLVDLLPYWNYTNIGIAPILDKIFFWNFLDTFFRLWYTSFTSSVLCVSVCFFVTWITHWNKKTLWNLHIWMTFFWFFEIFFWYLYKLLFVCVSVCLWTDFDNKTW